MAKSKTALSSRPRIVQIMPPEAITQFGEADFSPEAIKDRAQEKKQTDTALKAVAAH